MTPPGKTTQSAPLQNYRAALVREDVGTLFYLRPWIGIDWSELAALDDRVVIALLPAGKTGTDLAIWIQGERDSPAIQTCRKEAIAYWEKSKYLSSHSQVGEYEIQRFTRKLKDGRAVDRYLVLTKQGMLLTTRPTGHRELIVRLAGHETGNKSEKDDKSVTALFSIQPLSLARQQRSISRDGRDWVRSAERLGGEQLDRIRGEMRIAPEQAQCIHFEFTSPLVAPLEQAMRLLQMPAGGHLPPLALVTAQDDTISVWRWNSGPAMEAFGNLFDEMVEPGEFGEGLFADLLDGLKEDPESPQVDLRGDLFEKVGPRFLAYSQVSDSKSYKRQWLYVAECNGDHRERVQATLEKFFKGDRAVSKEEIGKHACWSVAEGKSLFIEVESENVVAFRAVAIGPEGLLLATDPALLNTTLQKDLPPTQGDSAIWQQLLTASSATVPANASARVLVNTSRRFTPALNVAYSQPPPYQSWEPGLLRWIVLGDDSTAKKLDSSDLPSTDDMQGFFLPGWLVFEYQADQLKLQAGFLDPGAKARTE